MSLPLMGQTVLVTRPRGQSAGLAEPLAALGATVFALPAIAIEPPEDPSPLDEALRKLEGYDWLILTSVNGVEAVSARLEALGLVLPMGLKLAAVGPATAEAMRKTLRDPDVVPAEAMGIWIAEAIGEVGGRRILLARGDLARPDLPEALRAKGSDVDDVVAYRIVRPSFDGPLPQACPDWIALTSSSGVMGTYDALSARGRGEWMHSSRLACIGPLTAATVREMGIEPTIVAETHTVNGLVEAIAKASEAALA